jgi:hypothetical protein
MIDSEEDIQAHLKRLENLHGSCLEQLPESYYETIAKHWFTNIGPAKTEEYGVTAWRHLGARGIAGEMSACYYRWVRLISKKRWLSDPSMFNAVVDTFGYAILMHCCFNLDEIHWDGTIVIPRLDQKNLLERLWYGRRPLGTEVIALRMAHNCYRGTVERDD